MKIAVAVWLVLFGLWPVFDPGHGLETELSVLDVAIHWIAGGYLVGRLLRR